MAEKAAHTSLWQTSDAMIIATFTVALIGEKAVYSTAFLPVPTVARYAIGVFLAVLGLSLILMARVTLSREKQPSGPGKPTTKIVEEGVFKFSRNPLYVGVMTSMAGAAFIFGSMWLLFLLLPLGAGIHFILILQEEAYLKAELGREYMDYFARVRRWL